MFSKIFETFLKVRDRGFIGPNWVRSLTSFFRVPKGEDDIRLVYDLTVSGLNGCSLGSYFLDAISRQRSRLL